MTLRRFTHCAQIGLTSLSSLERACFGRPQSTPPTPNYDRYQLGDRPAEQAFKLVNPAEAQETAPRRLEELPRPSDRPPEVPTPPGRSSVPPPPRPYELPPPPPSPKAR